MVFAVPLAASMLAATWLYLCFAFTRRIKLPALRRDSFRHEMAQLGVISAEEWQVLIVFCLTALLWITGADAEFGSFKYTGWISRLGLKDFVDDGTVGITMALLLFILPARRSEGGRLMRWEDAARLPWGIVLLFGGGFALAQGFVVSGLSTWCGEGLAGLAGMSPLLVVLIVCFVLTFLTELTSNTATTEMALPILAATAVAIGVNPLLLMVPGTLSASLGFMMPAGTPPNAIVFGTGHLTIAQMARAASG
jgi:sodium-dependent dicarboxylate transporter 2/3/5